MVKDIKKKVNETSQNKVVTGEVMTVPVDVLKQLKADILKLQSDRDMLLQVVDKKRMSKFLSANKGASPSIVKLRMIDSKVIIGWRTTRDEVFKDMKSGKWLEYQTVELLFEDKSSLELSYADYNRRYIYVTCKQMGTVTDDKGNLALKLERLDNHKKYVVDIRFVN